MDDQTFDSVVFTPQFAQTLSNAGFSFGDLLESAKKTLGGIASNVTDAAK